MGINFFYIKIIDRYLHSEGLQKIIHNIGWLSFDKILRMGVGLIVGVWVARYLGPEQYGLWNYAIAFAGLFGVFTTLGLDSIVVRNLVKDPSRRDEFLGTAFYMKLWAAIATLIVTIITVYYIKHGDMLTLYLVALSSIGFIFQSVYVIDFYFQSQVKSKYTVIAQNSAFIIMALVKIAFLLLKAPLIVFAIIGAVEVILSSVFLVFVFIYNHLSVRVWRFNKIVAIDLLRDSWPLILSGIAITIYMRIDQIMIGEMLGVKGVGIYSAAVRISEIWYFIPVSIVATLFPTIVENKKKNEKLYYLRLQKLFTIMTILGICVAVVMTFFSGIIIQILFGQQFEGSASVLAFHVWAGLFVCLGVASNAWIMVENLQIYGVYTTTIGCFVKIVLNFILIPIWGVNGTAIATVVSYFFSVFSVMLFDKTKLIGYMMLKSFMLSKGEDVNDNQK